MKELCQIIFLFDSDGLCKLVHLLVEELVGDELGVAVEIADRVLREVVGG